MSRMIDADEFKRINKRLLHCDFPYLCELTLEELLDEMPTVDAVPVVRCADCKHWGETDHGCHTLLGKCGYTGQCTPSFQFCCFGERRREVTE